MVEPRLRPAQVARYRSALRRRFRLRSAAACARFVDALGFCYAFTAGPGAVPGVFDVIGTRSVDRMWAWAWRWKEELATRRRVFYGRVLRRKPTFVSRALLPAFYALSGNVGDPDDHLAAYEAGRLSRLARDLYEAIARRGPLTTWDLRRRFVPRGDRGHAFHRALADLQERFLIAKVAEVEGRGAYAFIWDTFARWMPDAVAAAARLTDAEAAAAILRAYLRLAGAAPPAEVADLFRWPPSLLPAAAAGAGVVTVRLDHTEAWSLPELLPRLARG